MRVYRIFRSVHNCSPDIFWFGTIGTDKTSNLMKSYWKILMDIFHHLLTSYTPTIEKMISSLIHHENNC